MMKNIKPKIQEIKLTSHTERNMTESIPRHNIIKLLKTTDTKKNFKLPRKKCTLCTEDTQNYTKRLYKDKNVGRHFIENNAN